MDEKGGLNILLGIMLLLFIFGAWFSCGFDENQTRSTEANKRLGKYIREALKDTNSFESGGTVAVPTDDLPK